MEDAKSSIYHDFQLIIGIGLTQTHAFLFFPIISDVDKINAH